MTGKGIALPITCRQCGLTVVYRLAPDVSQEVRGERVSMANVRRRYPDAEFIDGREVRYFEHDSPGRGVQKLDLAMHAFAKLQPDEWAKRYGPT